MKKQLLNLGKALNKAEQKTINGGMVMGACKITTILSDGSTEIGWIFGLSDDPESQTAAGQSACGSELSGGADRCFYNCNHDGMNQ